MKFLTWGWGGRAFSSRFTSLLPTLASERCWIVDNVEQDEFDEIMGGQALGGGWGSRVPHNIAFEFEDDLNEAFALGP